MVFGESVNLPMRIVLNTLREDRRPHSSSAAFTDLWSSGEISSGYMARVFDSWRSRTQMPQANPGGIAAPAAAPAIRQSSRSVANMRAAVRPAASDPAKAKSIAEMKAILGNVMGK